MRTDIPYGPFDARPDPRLGKIDQRLPLVGQRHHAAALIDIGSRNFQQSLPFQQPHRACDARLAYANRGRQFANRQRAFPVNGRQQWRTTWLDAEAVAVDNALRIGMKHLADPLHARSQCEETEILDDVVGHGCFPVGPYQVI